MLIDSGPTLRAARQALKLSQAKLAELTGIPQQMLSSVELEKVDLDPQIAKSINQVIADATRVGDVAARKKRYQAHSYAPSEREPSRVAKARETSGNRAYRHLLEQLSTGTPPTGLTALSLFAGCGGMSFGFKQAGFKVKAFLELAPDLRAIYRTNFPDSVELGGDISTISDKEIAVSKTKVGPVDVLIGGPPCQGFSLSGKRSVTDPRNTLFLEYLRFVDVYQPKLAVMENVRLLTSMKGPDGGLVKDAIRREFELRGYRVRIFQVNAKDYGVPQHRERVFFVATRNDLPLAPDFPSATHTDASNDLFCGMARYHTFGDACSDLPYLESGEASDDPLHAAVSHPAHVIQWLWNVPEGNSAHDNTDPAMRPPSGYNTTYKRNVWNEPGGTVQTTFGMISGCRNVHPIATRSLTVREAARLQSFPDDYAFGEALGTMRTGIGNAVPPLLAYAIAKHFSELLQPVEVASL